jgi:hypothetical protein
MEEQGQDNLTKLKRMNLQLIVRTEGSLLAQIKSDLYSEIRSWRLDRWMKK